MIYMTNVNPSSSTYNTKSYQDAGPNESTCPHDEGSYPNLNQATYSSVNGHGIKVYSAGTVLTVVVTLNSSTTDASLTGTITGTGGGSVSLSNSGTHTQTFTVTVPAQGYISWNLNLSGTKGNTGYVSTNIKFTP